MKPGTWKGVFEEWGRLGGRKRAARLSRGRRSRIARMAALARWRSQNQGAESEWSIRLNAPHWDNPVFLEEVVSDGGLDQWRELYAHLSEFPFGQTAQALANVLAHHHVYGSSLLWRGVLRMLQGVGNEIRENEPQSIP